MSEPEWRSVPWLAEHYGVSVGTVRAWLARLPVEVRAEAVRHVERVVRVDRRTLDTWLKSNTKTTREAGNAIVGVSPNT